MFTRVWRSACALCTDSIVYVFFEASPRAEWSAYFLIVGHCRVTRPSHARDVGIMAESLLAVA